MSSKPEFHRRTIHLSSLCCLCIEAKGGSCYSPGIPKPPITNRPPPRRVAVSLCCVFGLCLFPSLKVRQSPPSATGAQFNRLGKCRVFFQPAARGQVVDVVAFAKLAVGKVCFGHMRLHSFAMESKAYVSLHSKVRKNRIKRKSITAGFARPHPARA